MIRLPSPPPEPPEITSLDVVAPKLRAGITAAIEKLRQRGLDPIIRETRRTDERQAWLFGMGRDYDDGRGIVTNAASGIHTWHYYGCAVDITSRKDGDDAEGLFWYHVGIAVEAQGLAWGGRWTRFTDRPHIQLGAPMRRSPSSKALELFNEGGTEAVWREVGGL